MCWRVARSLQFLPSFLIDITTATKTGLPRKPDRLLLSHIASSEGDIKHSSSPSALAVSSDTGWFKACGAFGDACMVLQSFVEWYTFDLQLMHESWKNSSVNSPPLTYSALFEAFHSSLSRKCCSTSSTALETNIMSRRGNADCFSKNIFARCKCQRRNEHRNGFKCLYFLTFTRLRKRAVRLLSAFHDQPVASVHIDGSVFPAVRLPPKRSSDPESAIRFASAAELCNIQSGIMSVSYVTFFMISFFERLYSDCFAAQLGTFTTGRTIGAAPSHLVWCHRPFRPSALLWREIALHKSRLVISSFGVQHLAFFLWFSSGFLST